MIGGNDIVFPAVGDAVLLEACAQIICRQWPDVRFEDAISGEKYANLDEIPFSRIEELLAYRNAEAEADWDAGSSESPENSMLNVIVRPDCLTVVLDNPDTAEMTSILGAIRSLLRTNPHLFTYASAA